MECRGISVMEDEGQLSDHTAGMSATDGSWHHIAVTWQSSDGSASLYDNGRKVRPIYTSLPVLKSIPHELRTTWCSFRHKRRSSLVILVWVAARHRQQCIGSGECVLHQRPRVLIPGVL
jgi:hypothetical protein